MAIRVRIWSTDLKVAVTKLDVFGKKLDGTVSETCRKICEQILKDSDTIPPVVPVDTGALQDSGRVEKDGRGWAVMYGGGSVDYALQVHDDLRQRSYRRPGAGPKFVEAHYLRRTEGQEAYKEFTSDIEHLIQSTGL